LRGGLGQLPFLPASIARRIEASPELTSQKPVSGQLPVVFKLVRAGCFVSFRIGSCVRFDPRTMAN
jgi:hypothetical protein